MSAITAANSSAYSAVASLLRNASSSAGSAGTSAGIGATASSAGVPVDSIDLSDSAKATLARAKTDQVAADKLAALVQAGRNSDGKPESAAGNVSQVFDQLTGRTQSQQASPSGEDATLRALGADSKALIAANTQPDGTVKSYSSTVSNYLVVPSTPQEISNWYKTDGQAFIDGAQLSSDQNYKGLAQAVQERTVTIQSAKDIPGLNFHNTATFTGSENGSSGGLRSSYNLDAAIFKDPTTSYLVADNGTVISWKKSPATGTTTSSLP
jgi:hypothetical protein